MPQKWSKVPSTSQYWLWDQAPEFSLLVMTAFDLHWCYFVRLFPGKGEFVISLLWWHSSFIIAFAGRGEWEVANELVTIVLWISSRNGGAIVSLLALMFWAGLSPLTSIGQSPTWSGWTSTWSPPHPPILATCHHHASSNLEEMWRRQPLCWQQAAGN